MLQEQIKSAMSAVQAGNQQNAQNNSRKTEKSTQTQTRSDHSPKPDQGASNAEDISATNENKLLKEYIIEQEKRMQQFKEKETKMIKLLLAIKKRGVDIDKIYNNDVINEADDGSDIEKGIPDNVKRVKKDREETAEADFALQAQNGNVYAAEADDSSKHTPSLMERG